MTSKSHLTPLSPVPAAKTRRGARTRQRLVEVAAAVFSDYGYSAARIADMVRMAGISHGNYARRRHLFRVMREAAAVNPDFARLWLSVRQGFLGRTAHWLTALVEAGQLEADVDVDLLAETLGSMMEHRPIPPPLSP